MHMIANVAKRYKIVQGLREGHQLILICQHNNYIMAANFKMTLAIMAVLLALASVHGGSKYIEISKVADYSFSDTICPYHALSFIDWIPLSSI